MVPALRRRLAGRVYYGWVVVGACLLAAMAVYGTSYTFSVFYDSLVEQFGVGRGPLAFVFGLQTALIYVGGVAAGRATDRYGGRRVAAVSGIVLVVGLGWAALARSYLELLVAFGVLGGLGMAGLYVVGYATVPRWFERRRGTASALAAAGTGIGLVTLPGVADRLITTVGWRSALLAVAGGAGFLALAVVLLFADRHADVGADPAVEFEGGVGTAPSSPGITDGTRGTLRSVPFLLVFVGWTFAYAPIYVLVSHVVPYSTDAGFGRSTGVFAITVLGITIVLARLGVGALSDRIGRVTTFVASAGLIGAALLALPLATTPGTFLAGVVVFAVGYSGTGGLLSPVLADLFGNEGLSTVFGAASLAFALTGLLAPPLAGFWFEAAGSYAPAFRAFGALGIVGACCVLLAARLTRTG
ncbi:MFS transporter [Salinirubellus sp. GCM10025818]|uniref:MFS transporter n=1 Tax=Salinirubellus TaxID=2162630 RepID=UPI0030D05D5E